MYECYVCGTSTKAKDDMINHINAEHKRSKSVQKTPKPKLDKIGKENFEFCAIFKIFPSNEKKIAKSHRTKLSILARIFKS